MKLHISFALLLAAGCGDGVLSDPESAAVTGHKGDGGTDGEGGTPVEVAQLCAQPEGPIHPYTQQAEVEHLIAGKWVHCSGPNMLEGDPAGIEFVSDGTYFALALQGSDLVRLMGFGKQGTWDADQTTPIAVQLNWHDTPASGNGGAPVFEDHPARFAIEFGFNGPAIYVRAE